jgi:TatD DNase family protein
VVDTHAHLGLCEPPAEELIAAAADAGVDRILTVGLGEDSNPEVVELARSHEPVFASVGRHPNGADGFDDDAAAAIESLAADEAVVAIGETGLDFYRDRAQPEAQRRAFAAQIEIAARLEKPVVIHVRDADGSEAAVAEAFETLAERGKGDVVLHCFSSGPEWGARAAELGWYCSFAGNVTYPNAEALRDAAAVVPADRILVETDAPYLAPQPVRGKPNQPANVVATARAVAEARGVPYDELEATIERNAARVFGW